MQVQASRSDGSPLPFCGACAVPVWGVGALFGGIPKASAERTVRLWLSLVVSEHLHDAVPLLPRFFPDGHAEGHSVFRIIEEPSFCTPPSSTMVQESSIGG